MTFLVIGEYFSENLGDPLLCEVVSKVLQREFEGVRIIPFDLSGKISMTQKYSHVENKSNSLIISKIKSKLKKFKFYKKIYNKKNKFWYIDKQLDEILSNADIDLAIFAGGEMFMDYFANKIYHTVKKLKDTSIIFHACGVYSISKEAQKTFKKIVYKKNVKSISLRDSYNKFVKLFPKVNPINTYDTALICSKFYPANESKNIEYGIGIIAREDLYEFQKQLITYFIINNCNWQLFTNGSSCDYDFAIKLLYEVGIQGNEHYKYLHKRPLNAVELVKQVTEYEKIISFRMHSQIVAASFGIPCFGFVWDEKVKVFYDKLELNNYAYPQGDIRELLDLNKLIINKKELSDKAVSLGEISSNDLVKSVKKALKM